jgi:hypothetical protein
MARVVNLGGCGQKLRRSMPFRFCVRFEGRTALLNTISMQTIENQLINQKLLTVQNRAHCYHGGRIFLQYQKSKALTTASKVDSAVLELVFSSLSLRFDRKQLPPDQKIFCLLCH